MIHPASLVDRSLHSTPLIQLLSLPVNETLTQYVIETTACVVDYGTLSSVPPESRAARDLRRAKFTALVKHILSCPDVTTPIVLTTLVYIRRAKPNLEIATREWALERVFLGSIVLAFKYLNDSCFGNAEWARCTGTFTNQDICRIERELLQVLDWELRITERDLLNSYPGPPGERKQVGRLQKSEQSGATQKIRSSLIVPQKKPRKIKSSRKSKRPVRPQFSSSDADRAILRKIRSASIRHELIAGVRGVEARIQAAEAENEALEQVIGPREGVELDQNVARAKMQVRQSKRLRAKLVKAALHGRRIRMNSPTKHITRWNWYEAAWAAINTGHLGRSIRCSIPFNDLPWPTLNVNRLGLEDYEAFVLSPARPRFETMYWFERVEIERAHWNLENVKQKVVPLVSEEISERVMRCAIILLEYLDSLVDKYTSCEE
ncbi:hypothetical protein AAF712_014658 [Marasmius tenuissimus]|uniref:Cyclin N-terminal domain-containing protein n=1 Tax=Marasmius tenuissimus TaxID=585030 RepID=A0ABR2ZBS8_9AGAR